MTKLAGATDEMTTLALGKVKTTLDNDWKGEFLLIERPDKNH